MRMPTGFRYILLAATLPGSMAATVAHPETLSLKEIRERGLVKQEWDTSCGAAAMATVFTYTFNDPVSEEEVARGLLQQTEPMKVRHRGGFSLLDMQRYAQQRGYRALAFREMALDDIRYLDAPIIPIKLHGYNHYVVYKGLTAEGDVRLADPAFGNRTLSRSSFDKAWLDGMAFVIHRGE